MHDPQLVPDLRAGLADPVPEVRMAAAWGFGNLGEAGDPAALREAVLDANDEVRAFAERAIQRMAIESPAPAR
jgi:HEAT repeat protein